MSLDVADALLNDADDKIIKIPRWKMKRIEDTLRLAHKIHKSSSKETCFDRCVCKAWDFAKESLNN